MTQDYCIGVDLGGTRVKALAIDAGGRVLQAGALALGADQGWKETVLRCIEEIIGTVHKRPDWYGVAAPGLVAPDERSVAYMPGRLPGLEGLDWTAILRSDREVPVINDAHAALLGEVWWGAATGEHDVIMLTIGTGIGGAILSGGRLVRGSIGRAGHIGHTSINPSGTLDIVNTPGSLEDAVGNCTLAARSAGRYCDTESLVSDVRLGRPEACEIWEDAVNKLAAALVSLINTLDPAAIVIGGGIAEAGDVLFTRLQARLDRWEWRPGGHRVRLVKAKLGDLAGAYGAAFRAYTFHGVINATRTI